MSIPKHIAYNYGGKKEIIDIVKNIAQGIEPDKITEQTIKNNLYCPIVPEVDLLIRPGAERRLNNFLL